MEYYKAISLTGLSLLVLINITLIKHAEASSKNTQLLNLDEDPDCKDPSHICYNFSCGDKTRGEFYSPNYPNEYPNATNCCKTIEAPHGKFITLEFRDSFNMEGEDPEKCENDYLEIRDGPQGYSRVLKKLCGSKSPDKVVSTGNALWLKFHSDENIQKTGFRAVYTFSPLSSKFD